ncbi:MAG: DUF2292 domain-containing protein [Oscillospiraceae bacterium]|nr:DUF2292 domain-containing protein [Oscillospiraceae bacterium]
MDSANIIELTSAEKKLITQIRDLGYGEVRIIVKDNGPIRIEEIRKSIRLTNDK